MSSGLKMSDDLDFVAAETAAEYGRRKVVVHED